MKMQIGWVQETVVCSSPRNPLRAINLLKHASIPAVNCRAEPKNSLEIKELNWNA
jgi:hypothetical protein